MIKRSHKQGRSTQRARFKKAAKACKGQSRRGFVACMRRHLSK